MLPRRWMGQHFFTTGLAICGVAFSIELLEKGDTVSLETMGTFSNSLN